VEDDLRIGLSRRDGAHVRLKSFQMGEWKELQCRYRPVE
jgi:hypothetical protein